MDLHKYWQLLSDEEAEAGAPPGRTQGAPLGAQRLGLHLLEQGAQVQVPATS